MISRLKGDLISYWHYGNKKGVILECCGIGYEIQILPRNLINMQLNNELILWIHQVFRDDAIILFGFLKETERDFFRKLISINGVGPQIAISLLEENENEELIKIITNKDINKLSKASGVGKRIAERICTELRDKLKIYQFDTDNGLQEKEITTDIFSSNNTLEKELKKFLIPLHYKEVEILEALDTVLEQEKTMGLKKEDDSQTLTDEVVESYLKRVLVLLSQDLSSKGT
mgnify:CR=1 FL=1|tara:strand:+ start:326 stop:1018 length:693 start_codon:yes stop_codon:yes gene_type:complete